MTENSSNDSADTPVGTNGAETKSEGRSSSRLIHFDSPDLTFDIVKQAIYDQAHVLFDRGIATQNLYLSPDIYEILNRRLVFKTAAHKDPAHFITPFGNLSVEILKPEVSENSTSDDARAFLIE